ncbi:hypothetical protein [Rahnella ecdela]|uniref:Uncharacterized protein n=1 Tax=Rahnella ecdela TaxID=2816250 RepID=A0ABS6L9P8_9GAMM|nr:hypothetical protein [Rahnella ecdela]MBU9843560.1 hypothetical protein [Rahnella ecdela]
MIGFEAMAFAGPNLDKVQGIFTEVSHSVERSLDDFDRSHPKSLTKKQVLDAIKKTDAIVDSVTQLCKEGRSMIHVLKFGSAEEIEALDFKENSTETLEAIAEEISRGNKRMFYTFFKAETEIYWAPHMSHLRYIKTRALQVFEDYQKVTNELARLVGLYQLKGEHDFSFDIEAIRDSVSSENVEHPDWVASGDDFADWIQSMKKDA